MAKRKQAPAQPVEREPATYTVVYKPVMSPIRDGDGCPHAGPDALSIGGRIEKNHYTVDATFCMACGTIRPVAKVYADYYEAFGEFWSEFGWHGDIGRRLLRFAEMATTNPYDRALMLRGFSPEDRRAAGIIPPNERYLRSKRRLHRRERLKHTKRWCVSRARLFSKDAA